MDSFYTVIRGDSLFGIAQRFYGDGNKLPIIAQANGIADPDRIFPGQVLVIPGIAGPPPPTKGTRLVAVVDDALVNYQLSGHEAVSGVLRAQRASARGRPCIDGQRGRGQHRQLRAARAAGGALGDTDVHVGTDVRTEASVRDSADPAQWRPHLARTPVVFERRWRTASCPHDGRARADAGREGQPVGPRSDHGRAQDDELL